MGRIRNRLLAKPVVLFRSAVRWLSSLPLWLLALTTGSMGAALGMGMVTFVYGEGMSYMGSDPKTCVNCHVMRSVYDGWNHGSHKHVAACNDCHLPHNNIVAKYAVKALNGWNHSSAFTKSDFHEPIMIRDFNRRVVQANCLHCHGEIASQISHEDSDDPNDCLRCHSRVGHG